MSFKLSIILSLFLVFSSIHSFAGCCEVYFLPLETGNGTYAFGDSVCVPIGAKVKQSYYVQCSGIGGIILDWYKDGVFQFSTWNDVVTLYFDDPGHYEAYDGTQGWIERDFTLYNCPVNFDATPYLSPIELPEPSDITLQEPIENFLLYPNPAINQLHLEVPISKTTQLHYSLYSTTGRSLLNESITTSSDFKKVIDISELPIGVYILHLSLNDKAIIRKVVKN
jgi:hypothetical protein